MTYNIDDYLKNRVQNQIDWYDKKSIDCQRKYKIFQIIEIIIAAFIPLLSGYATNNTVIALIIGVCGTVIAIIESITKLNKYHENWVQYRTTCELLRYQKQLFITNSAPYNTDEETIENIFVRNIENIISSENNKWKTVNTNDTKKNSN